MLLDGSSNKQNSAAGLGQAKPGHGEKEWEAVSGAATPTQGANGALGLKHSMYGK